MLKFKDLIEGGLELTKQEATHLLPHISKISQHGAEGLNTVEFSDELLGIFGVDPEDDWDKDEDSDNDVLLHAPANLSDRTGTEPNQTAEYGQAGAPAADYADEGVKNNDGGIAHSIVAQDQDVVKLDDATREAHASDFKDLATISTNGNQSQETGEKAPEVKPKGQPGRKPKPVIVDAKEDAGALNNLNANPDTGEVDIQHEGGEAGKEGGADVESVDPDGSEGAERAGVPAGEVTDREKDHAADGEVDHSRF